MIGHLYPSPRFGHTMVCTPPFTFAGGQAVTGAMTSRRSLLVFGGMHSMYCTNDVWQLRVRRRRTRFAKAGDGEDSGSDADDWIEAADDAGAGAVTAMVDGVAGDSGDGATTADACVVGPLVQWDPHAGSKGISAVSRIRIAGAAPAGEEWQGVLDDMQDRLLDMKMQLSQAQQRYAAEALLRQQAESERDAATARALAAEAVTAATKASCDELLAQRGAEVWHSIPLRTGFGYGRAQRAAPWMTDCLAIA